MSSDDPNTTNNSRIIYEIMHFKVHLSKVLFKLFPFRKLTLKNLSVKFSARFEDE